jgi:predicted CXXCH cytochrome family protein
MYEGSNRGLSGLLLALCLTALAGCVDEEVVFRDRELFEEPLSAAADFLGYTDHDDKLTVCGNCHIGPQKQWEGTAHASAWAGLQASGQAQATCEGCHTVNALGNVAVGDAGYTSTGEVRYEDVQCESCHGPGLQHVLDPSDQTVPLAAMAVGLDLTLGCAECHQGAHHPFADEWAQSGHGNVQASPAGREACVSCHTGEDALRMLGVSTVYLEQDGVSQAGEHLPITCAVCHDPHGSDNDAQLRLPVDAPNEEENLCMQCHHKRGVPDPTTFRGPHSPEGPTLLGTAGWWPPSLEFPGGQIIAAHGSEANPKLCASCHLQKFTVTDAETGAFVFQSTGHLFEATPCIDSDGIPTSDPCADAEKTFQGCVASGCHANENGARNLKALAELRIDDLVQELEGLLAMVPVTEFDETDARYTVGEGSQFNLELAQSPGAEIHNPFLIEALLIGSINEVESTYSLPLLTDVSLTRQLGVR